MNKPEIIKATIVTASISHVTISEAIEPLPEIKVEYPKEGGLQSETKAELTTLQQNYRNSLKATDKTKATATDVEYYSVIYFKNEAQRKEFYDLINASELIKNYNKFIKGEDLAKALNIPLTPVIITPPNKFKSSI